MRNLGLRVRPALVSLVPGVVLAASWLRLERPQTEWGRVLLLLLLAVAPAVAPRLWQRLVVLAGSTGLAVVVAAHAPALHPWRAGPRLWDGFLDFYDSRLPFAPLFHPEMHSLLLLAVFGFTAAVAFAAAARSPLGAVACFVVGAGWPATLLSNERDLFRGSIILASALFLLVTLRPGASRSLGRAAVVAGVLVAAAVAATTQPAVAKSEFLHWQTWNPYKRPPASVGVRYVWDGSYNGFTWPRKTSTVLKVEAPADSVYWRITTLDVYSGARWEEFRTPMRAELFDGRLDVARRDPLTPRAARNPERWRKAVFEVAGLADNRIVAPSVPVGYEPTFSGAEFWQGGNATLPRDLERGERYTAWSYLAKPTPAELAAVAPTYPAAVVPYLEVRPGLNPAPVFGTPGRAATMQRFFTIYPDYRPLYRSARRVVGNVKSPYGATLAIESWLRTTGKYTQHPPSQGPEPLLDFVLRTKRGYCQHFAGAMALMLRYLGIPARIAEGFTSGAYDQNAGVWTVTDHDAHAWVEVWFPRYGWLPFDPTPGRGYLSAAYSVSSPDFHARAAARFVGGVAGSLFNTAAIHQDVGFGEKNGIGGLVSDPRRPKPAATFGIEHRGGSLGKLVLVILAVLVSLLALAKALRRQLRYATPDPRRRAAACRSDLRDYLADQGIRVPPSTAPEELASLLRSELEVDAQPFASALAAARFGPPADADDSAARAREELGRVRAQVRRRIGFFRRVRGLVSLRSLGFAG